MKGLIIDNLHIRMVNGQNFKLPMQNEMVARTIKNPNSHIELLLAQIHDQKLYAPFFVGKRDLVFLDIGAYVGTVAIYASSACSRIVAVEPSENTFNVLGVMTSGFPNIERIRAALTPKNGPCNFFENNVNPTANSTVNTFGSKTMTQGCTLTALLDKAKLFRVDVCKIDAEGSEGEALSYSELEAARSIVRCYHIETHNCPLTTWNFKLGKLVEYLTRLSYKIQIEGTAITAALA